VIRAEEGRCEESGEGLKKPLESGWLLGSVQGSFEVKVTCLWPYHSERARSRQIE
jgi:hypothetical protein